MNIHKELRTIIPGRSREQAAAMSQEMVTAYERAHAGDASAGEARVLCYWQDLMGRCGDVHNDALTLIEMLWEMGLIEELPRTEKALIAQIAALVQKLRPAPTPAAQEPTSPRAPEAETPGASARGRLSEERLIDVFQVMHQVLDDSADPELEQKACTLLDVHDYVMGWSDDCAFLDEAEEDLGPEDDCDECHGTSECSSCGGDGCDECRGSGECPACGCDFVDTGEDES